MNPQLNFSSRNFDAVGDPLRGHFHQKTSTMKKWYQGKWSFSSLAFCSWTLVRNAPEMKYKRKPSVATFEVSSICNLYFDTNIASLNYSKFNFRFTSNSSMTDKFWRRTQLRKITGPINCLTCDKKFVFYYP